jgi:hypothetical protein
VTRNKVLKLPDWWPLETYSRDLTEADWINELWKRVGFMAAYENSTSGEYPNLAKRKEEHQETFEKIIKIQHSGCSFLDGAENDPMRSWPVRGVSWFECAFFAHLFRPYMSMEEKAWSRRIAEDPGKWLGQYYESKASERVYSDKDRVVGVVPDGDTEEITSQLHYDVVGPFLPIMVNVNLDDESLRTVFDLWLSNVREKSGEQKQPFGAKDLARWRKFCVLPAFDLATWSKISGAGYTDVFIANALWHDDEEFVDLTERYRKVTKPLVAQVVTSWSAQRLTNHARALRYAKAVAERARNENNVIPFRGGEESN